MNQTPQTPARRRSMLPLWILVAMFALPIAASWFFYLNPEFLPRDRTNRGQLIEPPRPMAELELGTPDGGLLRLESLQPNWALLTLAQPPCDDQCRQTLVNFRQIRKALAENAERLERLLILLPQETAGSPGPSKAEYAGTRVALASEPFLAALSESTGTPEKPVNEVFIIDPRGSLMMQYGPDASPKDILKDLERLMKASKNWVKGAQYGHR